MDFVDEVHFVMMVSGSLTGALGSYVIIIQRHTPMGRRRVIGSSVSCITE